MSTIEVTFQWDPGDTSVGIYGHWGEDTGVILKEHGVCTIFAFDPEDTIPAEEWVVTQVDVTLELEGMTRYGRPRYANIASADPPYWWAPNPAPERGSIKRHLLVGDLPVALLDAVKAEWARITGAEKAADDELARRFLGEDDA